MPEDKWCRDCHKKYKKHNNNKKINNTTTKSQRSEQWKTVKKLIAHQGNAQATATPTTLPTECYTLKRCEQPECSGLMGWNVKCVNTLQTVLVAPLKTEHTQTHDLPVPVLDFYPEGVCPPKLSKNAHKISKLQEAHFVYLLNKQTVEP